MVNYLCGEEYQDLTDALGLFPQVELGLVQSCPLTLCCL